MDIAKDICTILYSHCRPLLPTSARNDEPIIFRFFSPDFNIIFFNACIGYGSFNINSRRCQQKAEKKKVNWKQCFFSFRFFRFFFSHLRVVQTKHLVSRCWYFWLRSSLNCSDWFTNYHTPWVLTRRASFYFKRNVRTRNEIPCALITYIHTYVWSQRTCQLS